MSTRHGGRIFGLSGPCAGGLAAANVVATIGPSGVCALSVVAGSNEGGHYFWYFGPSGVCALPVVAGSNEGGHYFLYWSEPPWAHFLGFLRFFF